MGKIQQEPLAYIEKSHNIIDSAYNTAIAAYKAQKEKFLQQLQWTGEEAEKDFLTALNQQIAQEVQNNDELLIQIEQGLQAIAPKIQSSIVGNESLQPLKTELLNKATKKRQFIKYKTARTRQELDKYLLNVLQINKNQIFSTFTDGSGLGVPTDRAQSVIWGSVRKTLYTYITTGEFKMAIEGNKESLLGEYKEIGVAKALATIVQQSDNVRVETGQVGSLPNKNELSPIYDIMTHIVSNNKSITAPLDEITARMDKASRNFNGSTSVSEAIQEFTDYFGTQSKSWSVKFEDNINMMVHKYNLEVANRSDLQPTGDEAYYWHAGVFNAMSNLMSVIGLQQTLYSTGDQVYFTSTLLSQFQRANYVLAFATEKVKGGKKYKIVQPTIYFRHHTM